jgi:hypothetical protein
MSEALYVLEKSYRNAIVLVHEYGHEKFWLATGPGKFFLTNMTTANFGSRK